MGSISPFLRTPFTDITGGMVDHQLLGRCAKEEMAFMECMEAYGFDRGLRRCTHLLHDFKECQTHEMSFKRFHAMRKERDRQIAAGELTGDKKYLSPKIDSF